MYLFRRAFSNDTKTIRARNGVGFDELKENRKFNVFKVFLTYVLHGHGMSSKYVIGDSFILL